MMKLNSINGGICSKIPDWAEQLSMLLRVEWTDKDNICRFPYLPLTTRDHWEKTISKQWESGEMVSWVHVSGSGRILAHAALVEKDGCYEGGRWVAYPESPRGALTDLCLESVRYASSIGKKVFVEATQVHTTSQYICEKVGLVFSGISFGVNNGLGGIPLDIIHYDNFEVDEFTPQKGITGNSHGNPIPCLQKHLEKLRQVAEILSCERGGCLPPLNFHVLPHRIETVREIVNGNIEYLLET